MDCEARIKEIKQSFRLMMDGAVAKSMREKGMDYSLNWGATLPRLRQMADEIVSSESQHPSPLYTLAIALWKENVRECKILATMIMPPEEMPAEVCDIWMEQIASQEIAEQAAFNLWQHLPYAPEKAFQWIASDNDMQQLCGFHTLTRLFMQNREMNERGINEFLDQALAAVSGGSMAVRKAAMQSIRRFAELGLVYERMAKSSLKTINLELF